MIIEYTLTTPEKMFLVLMLEKYDGKITTEEKDLIDKYSDKLRLFRKEGLIRYYKHKNKQYEIIKLTNRAKQVCKKLRIGWNEKLLINC